MHYEWRFETLCRYVARPAVATERLSALPDGRLLYHLKHRWRDGTTHVVFERLEFVAKLAALVPPPRINQVRYHTAAALPDAVDPVAHDGCSAGKQSSHGEMSLPRRCHPRNYTWAELMKRVWEVDGLECDRCRGRMRITAAIHSPEAIRGILECLGLPTRAPPISPEPVIS